MRHTPGPWKIQKEIGPAGVSIWHEGEEIRSRIALLHDFSICAEHGGSTEANAQLIVSAPEMLTALKRISNHITTLRAQVKSSIAKGNLIRMDEIVMSAIEKAEGIAQ